jgi:hypothetical protein
VLDSPLLYAYLWDIRNHLALENATMTTKATKLLASLNGADLFAAGVRAERRGIKPVSRKTVEAARRKAAQKRNKRA